MKNRTMIERVARRLCQLDGHPESVAFEGALAWRGYVEAARAVLEELRGQTPRMAAKWAQIPPGSQRPPIGWDDLLEVAIAEGP